MLKTRPQCAPFMHLRCVVFTSPSWPEVGPLPRGLIVGSVFINNRLPNMDTPPSPYVRSRWDRIVVKLTQLLTVTLTLYILAYAYAHFFAHFAHFAWLKMFLFWVHAIRFHSNGLRWYLCFFFNIELFNDQLLMNMWVCGQTAFA